MTVIGRYQVAPGNNGLYFVLWAGTVLFAGSYAAAINEAQNLWNSELELDQYFD